MKIFKSWKSLVQHHRKYGKFRDCEIRDIHFLKRSKIEFDFRNCKFKNCKFNSRKHRFYFCNFSKCDASLQPTNKRAHSGPSVFNNKTVKSGKLIVYKKLRSGQLHTDQTYIATLEIAGSVSRIRPRLDSGKCRAAKAKVLKIETIKNKTQVNLVHHSCYSGNGFATDYIVGKMVYPRRFERSNNECAPGIHFFLTRREAARYRG